jgi:pimeloyl-ACP methyl ester carboxylesterase
VFAHATGFHGRVWDAIVAAFPAHPAYAIDLRGHGLSRAGPITDWRMLASDVADFLGQAGLSGAVGIGHSMGAHTLLQVAADNPGRFARLVLFDPVILAPEFYGDGTPVYTADKPHPAIRRKRDFASAEAMIERFATRDPYDLFAPRVFEDYCRFGLVPAASGEGMSMPPAAAMGRCWKRQSGWTFRCWWCARSTPTSTISRARRRGRNWRISCRRGLTSTALT